MFEYPCCRFVAAFYLYTCPQSDAHDSRRMFEFVRQQFSKTIEFKSLIMVNYSIANSKKPINSF